MNQNLQLSACCLKPPPNRSFFFSGLIKPSHCAPVTVRSLHPSKENAITVHSGEGGRDQYTEKEIIIYKCTNPVKRDVYRTSGRRERTGHFSFINLSDIGITIAFLSWSKTASR